ncbi:unnamed protein product [Adineta ricciae]|uniref:Uncharacterized protein n=1 Tax=Adineta ricciae TaxID=249248 RepID=A0A815VIJ7_ADIRI|nr:unnamed protein product [Adineta ricciae]
MVWLRFFLTILVIVQKIETFGENHTGIWVVNSSIPNVVYPLTIVGKSQGKMRVHVLHRPTTVPSTSTTTTTLSLDVMIDNYIKKST